MDARKQRAQGNTTPGRYQGALMVRGRGTGFVTLPGHEEDIVIAREALKDAFDGDIVEIELGPKTGDRQTGSVLRVIERARSEFIGTIEADRGRVTLRPDSRRIHTTFVLPSTAASEAGMKAAVRMTSWEAGKDPQAEVIEILGKAGDHETEMQAIIRGGGFAVDFPVDVQEAAKKLYAEKEQIFKDAIADSKRRDFRNVPTCTIDPKDAKDFDDAISIREVEGGKFEIGIHIADVSHYVREKEPIDKEAVERGTSIYLVDRVIPMLPEVLSNDLCSLKPDEDRLAFAAVFTMDMQGVVHHAWYGQTIIHSDKRFTYEEAQQVLDRKEGPLLSELTTLMDISRVLREERFKNGAIAFDQPEVKFELDPKGKPIRAYVKERTETMLMIEDFMLLANRKVAEHIYDLARTKGKNLAFVYRIHDVPNPDKVEELSIFLHALGYEFRSKGGVVDAKDINALLKEVEGKPEENLIKTATIRSMAKAIYSTKNIGHFGLAFKYYTHFTSPIRRYPDLMAHRLLRAHLDGSPIGGRELAHYEKLSVQSSERELNAVSAERESIKYKQVEYMQDKVGQVFDGVITGVTEWGIYVEEKESKSEGMVKLAAIKGDYYTHEPKHYHVRGEKTKKTYRLGDPIKVKLLRASLEERVIDFVLA